MFDLKEKLRMIVSIEKKKWQLKGPLNTTIAAVSFVAIMWSAVHFGKKLWPEHIEDRNNFVFIGSFCTTLGVQIIAFLLFLPGYLEIAPSYYKKYLINKTSTRPWERKDWPQVRAKTIKYLVINQLVVLPALFRLKLRFQGFPQVTQLVKHLLLIYFVDDFLFYWFHRTFHQVKFLYKFHKVHHEYDTLYTWTTQYFDPFDFIFGNAIPSGIAMSLLGGQVHAFTYLFWIGWKMVIGVESHCGYEFPFSPFRVLPLFSGPNFHDYHHSHNVGTYASTCYFWDLMMGSSPDYFKYFLSRKPIT